MFAAGVHEPPSPMWQMIHTMKNCNVAKLLERTQWSSEFETLMRNRLMMGAYRYGFITEQRAKGTPFDVQGPIDKKIQMYKKTGNTEYLVDAANYLMLVFDLDPHPTKHFHALDDHHDHCKEKKASR